MSILRRITTIFRAHANDALDRAEDPRRIMDYSYERQLAVLEEVRRGVADVAANRQRLALQVRELEDSSRILQRQAERAVADGRDDAARAALGRKVVLETELRTLSARHAQVTAEEERLAGGLMKLQLKVESFRARKESIKASYSAAEAQVRISAALSDLSSEMSDVGHAVRRAEDETARMQAHAGAMEELMTAGAFEFSPTDPVQRELDRLAAEADVERELARLKHLPLDGRRGA